MAARLPVIATPVGAVPEIIDNGRNGIIVPARNAPAIAKSLTEVLRDDRLRLELGIQAHQTVLFKFEQNKMLKEPWCN